EVKAAIFHTDRGVLVLPIWLGQGAQFVPGQLTAPKLTIVVPATPLGTQPWQITPAEVRSLEQERVVGGTKVTIPEFSLTSAILFTADNSPTGVLSTSRIESGISGKSPPSGPATWHKSNWKKSRESTMNWRLRAIRSPTAPS